MHSSRFNLRLLLAVLPIIVLSACAPAAPATEPFVVADLFATPGKALATVEISPTPTLTATIPNVPSPTPAPTRPLPTVNPLQPTLPIATFGPLPTQTLAPGVIATPGPASGPVACATPPPMPFTPVWQNIPQAQSLVRCPVGAPITMTGVWQTFEHGMMFWRESDRSIFVLSELKIRQGQPSDTWWRIDDTWTDAEPERDDSLQVPEGLRQPIRGFGKVWRNNGFIREGLGWATSDERTASLTWQQFEGGFMFTGPDGAPIYVVGTSDAPPHFTGIHLGGLPR